MSDPIPIDPAVIQSRVSELLPVEAPLLDPAAAESVVDSVVGLGPIEPLLRDPLVSDVLVNADGTVWVERAGMLRRAAVEFPGPEALVAAVERVIAPLGLRLDRASPAVDARLTDGSRLHAIVPPAAVDGPVLAIRRFTESVADLDELIAREAIRPEGASLLRELVAQRRNIVVAGATGTGKTTLLNILSREIDPDERIVTIEDAAELRLPGHVVRLEGRPPNSEGVGEISQEELLRHALRLRPDRLIVGEVRGAEAFAMLQAMSTGHDGSMSTVHARSANEALWRLETLALSAAGGASEESIHRQVRSAVDALVLVGRQRGRRTVGSVTEVGEELIEVYSCC
jgi:pilus assembly protein CpaF